MPQGPCSSAIRRLPAAAGPGKRLAPRLPPRAAHFSTRPPQTCRAVRAGADTELCFQLLAARLWPPETLRRCAYAGSFKASRRRRARALLQHPHICAASPQPPAAAWMGGRPRFAPPPPMRARMGRRQPWEGAGGGGGSCMLGIRTMQLHRLAFKIACRIHRRLSLMATERMPRRRST